MFKKKIIDELVRNFSSSSPLNRLVQAFSEKNITIPTTPITASLYLLNKNRRYNKVLRKDNDHLEKIPQPEKNKDSSPLFNAGLPLSQSLRTVDQNL